MQELLDIKESNKNMQDYYKYELRIKRLFSRVQALTFDEDPKDVLKM